MINTIHGKSIEDAAELGASRRDRIKGRKPSAVNGWGWVVPLISAAATYLGAKEQASATRHAADRADPFYGERFQYMDKLRELQANPASVQNLPGYQFQLNQGLEAVSRKFSAQGMGRSGNVLAGLTEYGQGLASQFYDREVNRLMTLSGATSGSPGGAAQATLAGGDASAAMWKGIGEAGSALWGVYNPDNKSTTPSPTTQYSAPWG
jgi:hypothetical protein